MYGEGIVMTTAEFIGHLERHRDQRLGFGIGAARVPAGYHVTEIKATTIRAVDCGGRSTAWHETTLQLWSPDVAPEGALMRVGKFLEIYGRVGSMVPIDDQARVRVEYGAPGEPAVAYVVTEVREGDDGVLEVRLAAPAVACKARDRSVGDVPLVDAAAPTLERSLVVVDARGAGCCGPSDDAGTSACCA
jgi:hypothetical protein